MKNRSILYLLILIIGLSSCGGEGVDEIIIENASVVSFTALEEKLASEKLASNPTSALPWMFLPVDSQFVMTSPIKYKRKSYATLPMTSRAYSDSLGNEVLIYEWDLIEEGMSEDEKNTLKHDFENQHDIYVKKYNELIDRVTFVLGPPVYADKGLKSNNLEVFKNYKGKNVWQSEKQAVEVSIFLLPTEIYRVTLKNFVFVQEIAVQ